LRPPGVGSGYAAAVPGLSRQLDVVRRALAVGIWLGCSRGETQDADAQRLGPATELASPTAFALVTTETGALLGWISSAPASVSLARFDAAGTLVGLVASSALEAASGARDVTLVEAETGAWMAWVDPGPGRVRAAPIGGASAPRVLDLGLAWSGSSPEARGNLALGKRDRAVLALTRGAAAPCADVAWGECFGFQFYELSSDDARATGVPLSVPVPCAAQAAQLVAGPRSSARGADSAAFEYAICTRAESGPVLTVFTIEPERQYAAAQRVLSGCVPLGAGRFEGESSFVAQCGSDRRMVTLVDSDRLPRERDISVRGVVCDGEQPRVRMGREWLGLTTPVDRLELLVGEDLAPPGARVAWTGRALLVVKAGAAGLELSRYACQSSQLVALESPAFRS
jgi:hypothetical protein